MSRLDGEVVVVTAGERGTALGPARCRAPDVTGTRAGSRALTVLASADHRGFTSLRHSGPPRAERYELGRRLRRRAPRSALGDWTPPPDRPDVVDQVIRSHEGRLEWLVPVRVRPVPRGTVRTRG